MAPGIRTHSGKDLNRKHDAPTGPRPAGAPDASAAEPPGEGSWLLAHKVELPDPVLGYLERPAVQARCRPTQRRLTVLHAPGGFGKTALLARCCQELREQGVAVAWLAVDEGDGAESVASCLWLALEQAGLGVLEPEPDGYAAAFAAHPAADSAAEYRIDLLLRAVRRHARPAVAAVDDLDRLRSPEAVAALNTVLQRAPPNLHFALAFRERPRGLDVAMFSLEGRAETLNAADLRFSPAQIARFFDPRNAAASGAAGSRPARAQRLSRAQLASVTADSAGWPIALRLYRNALHSGVSVDDLGTSDTAAAWIESRLWRGLSREDRDFVLDIALFDWIEPRLVDEATGRTQSGLRLSAMASLNGLLQTAGGDASAMRLHPLIREYCAARLFREDPGRFARIHAGIARALARRGHVLDALRHADQAGDHALIGEIAERAGGVELWLRRGADALRAFDGWLTGEVLAAHPRLKLVRCIARISSGDIEGARRLYGSGAPPSAGLVPGGAGEGDEGLSTGHLLARGMFAILGCGPVTDYPPLIARFAALAEQPELDPMLRAVLHHGMSIAHNEMGQFGRAEALAERARTGIGPDAPYVLPHIHYQLGLAAMATGRAAQAERRYERGLNIAQGRADDTGMVMFGTLLRAELDLQRSADAPLPDVTPVSPRLLGEYRASFDVHAAGVGVGAELARERAGYAEAMAFIERASRYARATGRIALARLVGALRVSLLLEEDAEAAERAWHTEGLPESGGGCLDLRTQRWREMEAVADARLRLLTARGRFEEARELARGLRRAADKRSLARTLMRALALSVRLEHEAGDPATAAGHLAEALRLLRRTGYARALARERTAVAPLLERLLDAEPPGPVHDDARGLHGQLTAQPPAARCGAPALLSPRELDVLRRLPTRTDREIARELAISYHAVRYYVQKLFARLGAGNRYEAARRARAMGLLGDADAEDASP